jgi:hypothetical protein
MAVSRPNSFPGRTFRDITALWRTEISAEFSADSRRRHCAELLGQLEAAREVY